MILLMIFLLLLLVQKLYGYNKNGVNLSNVRLYTERGILRDVEWYSNMNPSDVHIKDNVSI